MHLRKELDDHIDCLHSCEMILVDPEGSAEDQPDPERSYNPTLLRHFLVSPLAG